MFRIVEITSRPVRLSIEGRCLTVSDHNGHVLERAPLDELDALILAQPAVSLTGEILSEFGKRRIALVCCDSSYSPTACMLPSFVECTIRRNVLAAQCRQTAPLLKRIWQCLISKKIEGEARILRKFRKSNLLDRLPSQVKSGDKGNLESRAAVIYWSHLNIFPHRDRIAEDANRLLNYAYTILFSATARYLLAAGMEPRIGLHHSNPNNPFCLASDLMEPYRPIADECVIDVLAENNQRSELDFRTRRSLCNKLSEYRVPMNGQNFKFFDAIRQTVLSYRHIFMEDKKSKLLLPEYQDLSA